ncbi:hypothetical protein [Brachybacterium massiliense]|uniref:hypothetical protein n=1 Tax=Brachybacterium massiliense TaxID=1755098 RepID=UPI001120D0E5|nr:hypothetical protein [Brachybacterium massiliense]
MTSPSPRHTRLIGVLGTVAVLSYAVFAAVQIQVLNPLATVPGAELRQIHAAVGRTSDTMGWGLMFALLLPGPVTAASTALAGARGRLSRTALAMIMLGLLTGGSPIYLLASLPAGMTLADTFGVGGADHAPWALILHALSLLAVLALAALVIIWGVQAATASAAHSSAAHAPDDHQGGERPAAHSSAAHAPATHTPAAHAPAAHAPATHTPATHTTAAHTPAAAFAAPGSTAAIRSSTSGVCAVETNQASKADGGR